MKEVQRRKVHNNMEKPFPGCAGRMVNLFNSSAGVRRNKLLTDKPHRDGDFPFLFFLVFFLPTLVSDNCLHSNRFPNLYNFFFEALAVCY